MSDTKPSLRQRIFAAGGWTLGGYAFSQMARLASNIILARLLFPEAFGLMTIVQAVLFGVIMLTDVGLSLSIIRSPNGEKPEFLNTVWTLQIAKGVVVAAILAVIAWPVSWGYDNPMLGPMIAAIGLVAILGGARSTKADLAVRGLALKRLTIISVVSQLASIVTMITIAVVWKTPWALLWGNVAASLVETLMTHFYLPGPSNRFAWHRETWDEVFHFGAWILVSSAITYLSSEGLQLLRAALVDLDFLGQLGIAITLSLVVWTAIQKLCMQVFYPAYSEIWRNEPERFKGILERSRLAQLIPAWSVSIFLVFFGQELIGLLYDERYAKAALIMQINSVGLVVGLISASYTGVLIAIGKPGLNGTLIAIHAAINAAGIYLGAHYWGPWGMVVGSALSGLIYYPINAIVYGRHGLTNWRIDLPGFLIGSGLAYWMARYADWSQAGW